MKQQQQFTGHCHCLFEKMTYYTCASESGSDELAQVLNLNLKTVNEAAAADF